MKKIIEFIDILKSKEFKERVNSLGGYGFENTGGEIVLVD